MFNSFIGYDMHRIKKKYKTWHSNHRIYLSVHSEKILKYYSCIGGCLVAQNTEAEIWSNAW